MMITNKNPVMSEEMFFQKIYWLNKLSGELPETNFITDYARPTINQTKSQSLAFEFSDNLSNKIITLTQNSHFSLYIVLVSVLNILLYKYTGNDDIIIGLPPYELENCEEKNNQIIPLRFQVNNQLKISDFIIDVKNAIADAYIHQNYPFDELASLLKLPINNHNQNPFCNIIIFLENIHHKNDITKIKNYNLTFSFLIDDNSIKAKLYYNPSIFRLESIENLTHKYIQLVDTFLNNLNAKIFDITLVTKNEEYQLLETFNQTNTKTYPVTQCIHSLFEKQVKQTPNHTAVVFDNNKLTYLELNDKVNQLARFLHYLGIKEKEFVGILKERDINFLIAILAILKAGGCYVPIDNSYPPERIKYMVSHSEAKVLLTDSNCLNSLTGLLADCPHLTSLICLDIKPNHQNFSINIYDKHDFEQFPKENLELNHEGTTPAYMIYTSGSTGLPKGAIIRHGGAINHIYAQFDALELTENLSFLQSAPASSDISVWQFLAPLLIGGKTVIVDTETVCNPEKLFQVIKTEKITIVELVPVVLTGLLDYVSRLSIPERLLPHLKWMMVTGESVTVNLVNQWLQIYPLIKVVNAYGPTEAADDITQFIIEQPLPENQKIVPIGKPLANLNLYILDQKMELVPIGVPGEICVSGFGVGLGYWQNEESTKLNFVPNPFSHTAKPLPGTNTDFIYKTGDLGRWLPDGNIEFLGRIDHQVKIRGFRIELGEIEALLTQHQAVRETVVVVREENSAEKYLAAYVVPSAEYHTSNELVQQLRKFLKERLPEYMLPSVIVLLEALPLTPSGKVDRRALPVPDKQKNESEVGFVAPRNPQQEEVAHIWSQILKREQIGIYDNFFDLGGHSLLATLVISRLRETFQVELPLRSLFEEPTVAQLVERIEKMLTVQQLQLIPKDRAGDREEIEL